MSKSKEQLVKAHDVIRGSASSLAKQRTQLNDLLPASGKSYLVAATIVPSAEGLFDENAPQARILRMANSGSVSLGEDGEMTSARVQLIASSDTMADKLTKIVQGMAAIASLAETNDEHLNRFLQSVTVVRTGNSVQLSLAYPTSRLVEMIQGTQEDHGPSQAQHGQRHEERPFPNPDSGLVVGQWTADKQLPGDAPTPENLATQAIDTISLTRGAVVTISGSRHDGENARIDFLELDPIGGTGNGATLRFEAEFMRLDNYRVEKVPFASGGELVIITSDRGSASFQFQGATGEYRATIGYVDEADGSSRFAISVRNVEPKLEKTTDA